MSEESVSPFLLLRSFLAVASGYVFMLILFSVIMFGLGYAFFPQFVAWCDMEVAVQEQVMAKNPLDAIPLAMFWSMVCINFIAAVVVGWLVFKTAPFANHGHAVLLAILLFVFFLQIVINDPTAKKWMDIVHMSSIPVAVLLGARLAIPRLGDDET